MSCLPSPADLESLARYRVEDALRHRRVLNAMIDVGAELIGLLHAQAKMQVAASVAEAPEAATALPVVDVAVAYERISRAVRRSVLLVQRLGDARAKVSDDAGRIVARRKIVRTVEDVIHRDADADTADGLRAELAERLDGPELDDEIGSRPVTDIISEILADMGLGSGVKGLAPWPRRRPADVAALCALAGRVRLPVIDTG